MLNCSLSSSMKRPQKKNYFLLSLALIKEREAVPCFDPCWNHLTTLGKPSWVVAFGRRVSWIGGDWALGSAGLRPQAGTQGVIAPLLRNGLLGLHEVRAGTFGGFTQRFALCHRRSAWNGNLLNTAFTVLGDSSYPCYLVITFKSFH